MTKPTVHGARIWALGHERFVRTAELPEDVALEFAKYIYGKPRCCNDKLIEWGWWDAVDLDLWLEFNAR